MDKKDESRTGRDFDRFPVIGIVGLAIGGEAVLCRELPLVAIPAAAAGAAEEEGIEAEPMAAGRGGDQQAGDQFDQVLALAVSGKGAANLGFGFQVMQSR